MDSILILGGYGNFGARIAASLLKEHFPVIIAGRSKHKAGAMRKHLATLAPESLITTAIFDANIDFGKQLQHLKPAVVINTIGPFQDANYAIAEACIANKVHYLDLASHNVFLFPCPMASTVCLNKSK